MHILVINDDGPPSNQSSPYVHSLIRTLQGKGHTVSVVLPHVQRSWIGKAHFVGQSIKPTYFRPGTLHQDDGTTHERPLPKGQEGEEWILVDGTPATCAQLGMFHFFQDQGPIDLVVSGPNYGRNSTSLFSLSSGTIGGAMEAACCRKKAIAISYAFYSRDHDPALIAGASRHAARLIEHIYNDWGNDVDLYSINVPLVDGVEQHKTIYTHALQNYWHSGSSFEEVEPGPDDIGPNETENDIRHQGESPGQSSRRYQSSKHKHFRWAPKFGDISQSVEEGPPGNDGWALKQGYTSVTPLKANFMHAPVKFQGELKLSPPSSEMNTNEPGKRSLPSFFAVVDYEDAYVQPLILNAFGNVLRPNTYQLVSCISELPERTTPFLQISAYETIDFKRLLQYSSTSLANSYVIRKALIRKHYLSNTISSWLTKHPESQLVRHIKPSLDFELDYAEFLDEALLEAYELHESFSRNSDLSPVEREWWILKPSMSDGGQGIRLFSTEDELRAIFEEWEAEQADSDDEIEASELSAESPALDPTAPKLDADILSRHADSTGIITSQLRHFVAQPYIHPPLLFPSHENRKFHIRSYVLAMGALRVYVYKEMLALFAAKQYPRPGSAISGAINTTQDLCAHLTNTCLQDESREGSVIRFWDLPSLIGSQESTSQHSRQDWKATTYRSICAATSELFLAAARSQSIHFQTLPNAFEIFGIDWMVDSAGEVFLLEVNAFPDFRQTGDELRDLVGKLWDGVVALAVAPFFGSDLKSTGDGTDAEEEHENGKETATDADEERWGMRKVLDVDLGRR